MTDDMREILVSGHIGGQALLDSLYPPPDDPATLRVPADVDGSEQQLIRPVYVGKSAGMPAAGPRDPWAGFLPGATEAEPSTTTDPLTALNAMIKSVDDMEADYRHKLDQLNDLGSTNEQIATVAIQRKTMMMTVLFAGPVGPSGARFDELGQAAVDALRHCGRLT